MSAAAKYAALVISVAATLPAVAGCSAKPLQPTGNGGGSIMTGIGGGISTGAGGAGVTGVGGASVTGAGGVSTGAGGAGGAGATTDGGFAGGRAYTVASTFDYSPAPDGGAPGNVVSQTFTMVVDVDRGVAIAGASGGGAAFPVQSFADGFGVVGAIHLSLPGACSGYVTYNQLTFSFENTDRLRGHGTGEVTTYTNGVANTVPVNISLVAVADTVPPTLVLSAGVLGDPFSAVSVVPSEPLPFGKAPVLRAASGDVALTAILGDGFAAGYSLPPILLRFGESYRVDLSGISDFAGNAAVSGMITGFTTRSAPDRVAADGFESTTATTVGGADVLRSDDGDSVINGARSLYLPRVDAIGPGTLTQFMVRLPIASGSTIARFSYQNVDARNVTRAQFAVAMEGTVIVKAVVAADSGPTTAGSIKGAPVMLGPVATISFGLPAGAIGEVVVARLLPQGDPCGAAAPPVSGIIIDDLRTE